MYYLYKNVIVLFYFNCIFYLLLIYFIMKFSWVYIDYHLTIYIFLNYVIFKLFSSVIFVLYWLSSFMFLIKQSSLCKWFSLFTLFYYICFLGYLFIHMFVYQTMVYGLCYDFTGFPCQYPVSLRHKLLPLSISLCPLRQTCLDPFCLSLPAVLLKR